MASSPKAEPPNDFRRGDYHLPRDMNETTRLNAQHHALVLRSGWLLHPKIQDSILNIREPQIADVACGNGVWTFEVAEKLPRAWVTGLDISTKQFPPEWSWPSNGRLETLDLSREIPQEYRGKFDVVHCRFLLAAGPMVDPKVWADAFSKLLKPGGWLQWQEMAYPTSIAFEPIRDGTGVVKQYKETPNLTRGMAKVGKLAYKCAPVPRFGEWMRENTSFQDIEHIDMPPSPQHGRLETNVICGAIFGGANLMLQLEGLDEITKDQLKEDAAIGEMFRAAGILTAYQLGICLAKAPGG